MVRFHSIIFPFWKKLLPDMEVEMFEGQVKKMPTYAYEYFDAMQQDKFYLFNIYNLLYDTDRFSDELNRFNINFHTSS